MTPVNAQTDGHLIEHRIDSEIRIEGGFLTVKLDTVRLPDGSQATREFIQHPGAVAVVPLLDDGRLVLVRQYRYPVQAVLLELPAGKRDPDELALACAARELREETGYVAREWAYAGGFNNAAAYSSEVIEIWFARGLMAGPQQLDAGEFVETFVVTSGEFDALCATGKIPDMKTMIGLQWLQRWRAGDWPLEWVPAP